MKFSFHYDNKQISVNISWKFEVPFVPQCLLLTILAQLVKSSVFDMNRKCSIRRLIPVYVMKRQISWKYIHLTLTSFYFSLLPSREKQFWSPVYPSFSEVNLLFLGSDIDWSRRNKNISKTYWFRHFSDSRFFAR